MKNLLNIFRFASLDQNGILIQLLGLYPAVVLCVSGKEGLVMGFFVTLLLLVTCFLFSLIRPLVSENVRLIVLALLVGTQCAALSLFVKAYFPAFFSAHQIFFEMLCVTGLVFARGDTYARFNSPIKSLFDALGTGVGYTAVLILLGLIREFFGAGTLFDGTFLKVSFSLFPPMGVLIQPAGGLILLGFFVALYQAMRRKQKKEEK